MSITRYRMIGAAYFIAALIILVQIGLTVRDLRVPTNPKPNSVDIGFSQDMATHHTQAVLMARIVLGDPSASSSIRALAEMIEANQAEELGEMHGWLKLWNVPTISAEPMVWMQRYDYLCTTSAMPGLATEAQMEQLRQTKGATADRMFVKMMLYHHEGAIPMIEVAMHVAATPQVRNLAANMLFEQSQEIVYLSQLAGTPVPAGVARSQ